MNYEIIIKKKYLFLCQIIGNQPLHLEYVHARFLPDSKDRRIDVN